MQARPGSSRRFVTEQLLGASVQACKTPRYAENAGEPLLTSVQQLDPVCHRVFPSKQLPPAAAVGLMPPVVSPGESVQLCEVGDEAALSFLLTPASGRTTTKKNGVANAEASAQNVSSPNSSGFLTVFGGSLVCRESLEAPGEGEQQQEALQFFDQRAAVSPGNYDINSLFAPGKPLISGCLYPAHFRCWWVAVAGMTCGLRLTEPKLSKTR